MLYNSIYFESGGFYMFYLLTGAIQEIHTEYNRIGSKLNKKLKFYGNSAGAACGLFCFLILQGLVPISILNEWMLGPDSIIDRPRPFSFSLTPVLCEFIDSGVKYWPTDLYKIVSGILHIGVSTDKGHMYISEFNSNADIYHALLCSGAVAGLTSYDTIYKGQVCIDGFYTFQYKDIQNDCLVLTDDLYFPFVLTIPPKLIRTYLMAFGSAMVSDKCNNRNYDRGTIRDQWRIKDQNTINLMFSIHKMSYKNPLWKKHIENKTNSRIMYGPPDTTVTLLDRLHYAFVSQSL